MGLERYLFTIAALLPFEKGKGQTDLAASLLMEMVGALLMARCTTDDEASVRVLEKARRSVEIRCREPQRGASVTRSRAINPH